ncbi:Flp pilus assembly complex ATPase component [Escherichia coli]|nr:Flp pilus assembly complex ATPase component [Escherichia coli]EKY5156442.1 Flp pilus assembly complex ATPase component TadA [Escherichia coli]
MLDPADLPPDDILDYVAIDTDNAGQLRIRVVEGKKHLRAVQEYLTRLRARYQGRVGDFEFTTLDVIARIREATTIAGQENGMNPVQNKMLGYIRHAATLNASDLHITPGRDNTDFTYVEARVHGELEILDIIRKDEGVELLGATYSGMTDVIKGTQFDPSVPQDARLAEKFLKLAGLFGARYSHYPCVGGLYAVLRLIKDDSSHIPTFGMLGYHPKQEQTIRRILQRPEGIITLSGPTGSGKSTTLRTASAAYLEQHGFNNTGGILLPRRRLFTIESPPEGRIPGAIQTAVMDSAQGWVDSIKSALRLDPDGILNGEIRDHDSAITAIKAAMTGHLMLTTIHANDPINILERLEMEGVQARMIADPQLFIGLLSQRLVQLICPHCRHPWNDVASRRTEDERRLVETFCNADAVYLRNHDGCPHCWRGVTGRTVIAEVISPDARFFQLYREKGRIEAKTYWHRELGGMTRNQHLLGKINSGLVDPLAAHYISPIDEDSYTLLR